MKKLQKFHTYYNKIKFVSNYDNNDYKNKYRSNSNKGNQTHEHKRKSRVKEFQILIFLYIKSEFKETS